MMEQHIEERLECVLGEFQKDFEGGFVSAENLGAKFGVYGSFLPAYKRVPSDSPIKIFQVMTSSRVAGEGLKAAIHKLEQPRRRYTKKQLFEWEKKLTEERQQEELGEVSVAFKKKSSKKDVRVAGLFDAQLEKTTNQLVKSRSLKNVNQLVVVSSLNRKSNAQIPVKLIDVHGEKLNKPKECRANRDENPKRKSEREFYQYDHRDLKKLKIESGQSFVAAKEVLIDIQGYFECGSLKETKSG